MWLVAVTAELFTDVEACPAATRELPQEENPARPFTCQATASSGVFSQNANTSICAGGAMDSLSASCLALNTYPVASWVYGGVEARRDLGAITTHPRAEAEVNAEYPGVAG